jgi:hypothetical protein
MSLDLRARRRVKVYQLDDGQWEDKGTGHVVLVYNEANNHSFMSLCRVIIEFPSDIPSFLFHP